MSMNVSNLRLYIPTRTGISMIRDKLLVGKWSKTNLQEVNIFLSSLGIEPKIFHFEAEAIEMSYQVETINTILIELCNLDCDNNQ